MVMPYSPAANAKSVRSLAVAGVLLAVFSGGCSQTSQQPGTGATAAALNAKGVAAKDPKAAREWFQKAIAADSYYGPAYNNLGIVLLNEGEYFEAAKAFDQAIRNMPNNPEPRVNLGLVYEDADQLEKARDQYQQALTVAPESIDALQALTRVQVRLDRVDDRTVEAFRQIALRGTDAQWQSWAKSMLIRFAGSSDATQP
ncbi:MAG TPA: tetratricopeptide repeat protein [Phycisphaerae bacterium]|nr:tetratricopeptide repeat protein [Phycisphaerae bacterium]